LRRRLRLLGTGSRRNLFSSPSTFLSRSSGSSFWLSTRFLIPILLGRPTAHGPSSLGTADDLSGISSSSNNNCCCCFFFRNCSTSPDTILQRTRIPYHHNTRTSPGRSRSSSSNYSRRLRRRRRRRASNSSCRNYGWSRAVLSRSTTQLWHPSPIQTSSLCNPPLRAIISCLGLALSFSLLLPPRFFPALCEYSLRYLLSRTIQTTK
jgi:hypothetical protein